MNTPPSDARVASSDPESAEVTIRRCIATPSRLVLFFNGVPDDVAAGLQENYSVGAAPDGPLTSPGASPEYDATARVTVLRNPVEEVGIGGWLRVIVRLGPAPSHVTHYVRVQSELPLLQAAPASYVNEGDDAERDREATGMRPAVTVVDRGRNVLSDPLPAVASKRKSGFELTPGLFAVVTGLAALVVLGVVAMVSASTGDMGTIATAAFGVIGSVIGAFFGVHAGLGDRERVDAERQLETTKGQMLAAMMPEDKTQEALDMLKQYAPTPPSASA